MGAQRLPGRAAAMVMVVAMVGLFASVGSTGSAAAGSAVTGTGDWSMFRDGPALNGVNRAERALSPSTVPGLKVLHTYPNWSEFDITFRNMLVVGSIAYGQTFAVCGSNCVIAYVTAFQLPGGKVIWRHSIQAPANTNNCRCQPAISNGILYAGGDNAMYAFNAATGSLLWKTQLAPAGSRPGLDFNETTVVGSIVYASTYYDEKVYAFNAKTGAVLWSAAPSGCCMVGPVSVANGFAYVVTDHLIAYNATTGALVFTATPAMYAWWVAVSNGVAFVLAEPTPSTNGYDLDAFNATTGALLWSSPTGTVGGGPAVDGSTVVAAAGDSLIAFAASDGHRLWTVNRSGGFGGPPAIANGVVYAAVMNGWTAVNEATGAILYSSPRQGSFTPCSDPIVSHSAVWIGCSFSPPGIYEYGL